jgi:hypothetical protein
MSSIENATGSNPPGVVACNKDGSSEVLTRNCCNGWNESPEYVIRELDRGPGTDAERGRDIMGAVCSEE